MSYGEKNGIQAILACCALGVGFLVGLLYAIPMALRRCVRHSAVLTAAEDIVFCVAAAFITFLFFLEFNGGTVRAYLILSEAVGFFTVRTATAKIIAKTQKKTCKLKGK